MRLPGRRAGVPAVLVVVAALATGCGAGGAPACATDALTTRALADLDGFTGWVAANGVSGTVGEVGWPEGEQWRSLAESWYAEADAQRVGVFAWSAAQWWPEDYPLAIYSGAPDEPGAVVAGEQAQVVEAHAGSGAGAPRGVAVADATFGASVDDGATYSSTRPGTAGTDYEYPSAALLARLAAGGTTEVRLGVMWERLQPTLRAPLDPAELARLTRTLDDAAAAGLSVVLDLHNYGRYARGGADGAREVLLLGSDALPATTLEDLWRRLVATTAGRPEVVGFGIMNEPHDLPGGAAGWEQASRSVVAAIRETDTSTPVLVGGYSYSGVSSFAGDHPRPWIDPALGPVTYEAHQYFDPSRSGTYAESYDDALAAVGEQGWTGCGPAPA